MVQSKHSPHRAEGTIKWGFQRGEHPLWSPAGLIPRRRNALFICGDATGENPPENFFAAYFQVFYEGNFDEMSRD
jgi:hypothetical protein